MTETFADFLLYTKVLLLVNNFITNSLNHQQKFTNSRGGDIPVGELLENRFPVTVTKPAFDFPVSFLNVP